MRITIVGSGKVGFTLAKQLVNEGHDVTVIDQKDAVLENTVSALDVTVINGNGASFDVLQAANIKETDILIAATSSDEVNIVCCALAKKLGADATIARIRNPEYAKGLSILQEDLGLSLRINPEHRAALAIAKSLRFSSEIKTTTFAKGRLEVCEFKINPGSMLIGKTAQEIKRIANKDILLIAIERHDIVIIPNGRTVIEEGDKVSITGSTTTLEEFFFNIGIIKTKNVNEVMIVGGSRICYYLTEALLDSGIEVKIIEQDKQRCVNLVERFPEANIICGDGTSQELLNSENIEQVDAFVALTGNDEENIIASLYAKSQGVQKVFPKANHTSFGFILDQLGLENTISPKTITANQIVQYVRARQNAHGSNVESLIKIVDDKVEVLEFIVKDNCKFLNVPLKDLKFKKGILISHITRATVTSVANGNSELHVGDTVNIISSNLGLIDINDVLLEA